MTATATELGVDLEFALLCESTMGVPNWVSFEVARQILAESEDVPCDRLAAWWVEVRCDCPDTQTGMICEEHYRGLANGEESCVDCEQEHVPLRAVRR